MISVNFFPDARNYSGKLLHFTFKMLITMKTSSLILFFGIFSLALTPLSGQDCSAFIERELTMGGLHVLRSVPLTLVIRGTYSYSIQIINDEKGLRARVISRSGVEFNQDDEIIFMDVNSVRKGYRFVEMGEMRDDKGTPEYHNFLQINLAAVQWFSEVDITTIYIKNNISREMRKFTVNPNRLADFRA